MSLESKEVPVIDDQNPTTVDLSTAISTEQNLASITPDSTPTKATDASEPAAVEESGALIEEDLYEEEIIDDSYADEFVEEYEEEVVDDDYSEETIEDDLPFDSPRRASPKKSVRIVDNAPSINPIELDERTSLTNPNLTKQETADTQTPHDITEKVVAIFSDDVVLGVNQTNEFETESDLLATKQEENANPAFEQDVSIDTQTEQNITADLMSTSELESKPNSLKASVQTSSVLSLENDEPSQTEVVDPKPIDADRGEETEESRKLDMISGSLQPDAAMSQDADQLVNATHEVEKDFAIQSALESRLFHGQDADFIPSFASESTVGEAKDDAIPTETIPLDSERQLDATDAASNTAVTDSKLLCVSEFDDGREMETLLDSELPVESERETHEQLQTPVDFATDSAHVVAPDSEIESTSDRTTDVTLPTEAVAQIIDDVRAETDDIAEVTSELKEMAPESALITEQEDDIVTEADQELTDSLPKHKEDDEQASIDAETRLTSSDVNSAPQIDTEPKDMANATWTVSESVSEPKKEVDAGTETSSDMKLAVDPKSEKEDELRIPVDSETDLASDVASTRDSTSNGKADAAVTASESVLDSQNEVDAIPLDAESTSHPEQELSEEDKNQDSLDAESGIDFETESCSAFNSIQVETADVALTASESALKSQYEADVKPEEPADEEVAADADPNEKQVSELQASTVIVQGNTTEDESISKGYSTSDDPTEAVCTTETVRSEINQEAETTKLLEVVPESETRVESVSFVEDSDHAGDHSGADLDDNREAFIDSKMDFSENTNSAPAIDSRPEDKDEPAITTPESVFEAEQGDLGSEERLEPQPESADGAPTLEQEQADGIQDAEYKELDQAGEFNSDVALDSTSNEVTDAAAAIVNAHCSTLEQEHDSDLEVNLATVESEKLVQAEEEPGADQLDVSVGRNSSPSDDIDHSSIDDSTANDKENVAARTEDPDVVVEAVAEPVLKADCKEDLVTEPQFGSNQMTKPPLDEIDAFSDARSKDIEVIPDLTLDSTSNDVTDAAEPAEMIHHSVPQLETDDISSVDVLYGNVAEQNCETTLALNPAWDTDTRIHSDIKVEAEVDQIVDFAHDLLEETELAAQESSDSGIELGTEADDLKSKLETEPRAGFPPEVDQDGQVEWDAEPQLDSEAVSVIVPEDDANAPDLVLSEESDQDESSSHSNNQEAIHAPIDSDCSHNMEKGYAREILLYSVESEVQDEVPPGPAGAPAFQFQSSNIAENASLNEAIFPEETSFSDEFVNSEETRVVKEDLAQKDSTFVAMMDVPSESLGKIPVQHSGVNANEQRKEVTLEDIGAVKAEEEAHVDETMPAIQVADKALSGIFDDCVPKDHYPDFAQEDACFDDAAPAVYPEITTLNYATDHVDNEVNENALPSMKTFYFPDGNHEENCNVAQSEECEGIFDYKRNQIGVALLAEQSSAETPMHDFQTSSVEEEIVFYDTDSDGDLADRVSQQDLIRKFDNADRAETDAVGYDSTYSEAVTFSEQPLTDINKGVTFTKPDEKEHSFLGPDRDRDDIEQGFVQNQDDESEESQIEEEIVADVDGKDHETNKGLCDRAAIFAIACAICLLLITLALAIPFLLKDDDGDNDREISFPTKAPDTIKPTPAPRLKYELASGPYDDNPDTGFGKTISFDSGLLLVGLPNEGQGLVRTFQTGQSDEMLSASDLLGEQEASGFGWSVDVSGTIAAIGSPFLFIVDTPTEAGGVYVYEYSGSNWSQVGETLRGDEDLFAANEAFGSSVSVAVTETSYRVVVGAPVSNLDDFEIGRVYTFEWPIKDGSAWAGMESTALLGERAGDRFGSSVAISKDGSMFVAGGPGGDLHDEPGLVFVYQYVGESSTEAWEMVFSISGTEGNERFGASVAILSANGDTFAIGAPDYESGSGRVVVYRRGDDGVYQKLGSDIVGERGESLGETNTLSGSSNGDSVQIVVGTAKGKVVRYDYSAQSQSWSMMYEELDLDYAAVTSISVSGANSGLLAIGSEVDGVVSIYKSTDNGDSVEPDLEPPAASPVAAPVSFPTGTVASETVAPTFATLLEWSIVGGPFNVDMAQSGYGSSLAMSDTQVAVGAPFAGLVKTYRIDPTGTWSESAELTGRESSDGFGYSLDMDGSGMLVGAPLAGGAGAAYYYENDGSGQWMPMGDPLLNTAGPDGFFGSSVAISASRVGVVGAVGFSGDGLTGRGAAYLFEFADGWSLSTSEFGTEAGDSLGHAVDIDSSGTMVLLGAPGNKGGYAIVLEKKGSIWDTTLLIRGQNEGDAFGTSVKVLSPYHVAVGAPGYLQGRGRVVVYQRVRGTFEELVDVVGDEGDELGSTLKLAGSGTTLLVGRVDGFVKRLEFDATNSKWIQTTELVDSGVGSGLQAIATPSDDPGMFAASGAETSVVYSLL
jgi:hypothetical protein